MTSKRRHPTNQARARALRSLKPNSAAVERLEVAILHWRTIPEDPHGIANAVIAALTEVKNALS